MSLDYIDMLVLSIALLEVGVKETLYVVVCLILWEI